MQNFKEIAEKCAAGELYGTIILKDGREFYSKYLSQYIFNEQIVEDFYTIGLAKYLFHVDQIIDFIPNNMQEQIEIDIPEGKVPVMEQTENGVVITWKNKELTYNDISDYIWEHGVQIGVLTSTVVNENTNKFSKKVEVLRKLTNIRNYFGKPKHDTYGHALYYTIERGIHTTPALYPSNDQRVVFDTKEHAEQAIKMLGDKLKYLFEPW